MTDVNCICMQGTVLRTMRVEQFDMASNCSTHGHEILIKEHFESIVEKTDLKTTLVSNVVQETFIDTKITSFVLWKALISNTVKVTVFGSVLFTE